MAHDGTARCRSRSIIYMSLLLHAACVDAGNSEPDPHAPHDCPAEVDDLLAEVDQPVPRRVNCGSFNSGEIAAVRDALDCLLLREAGASTELTVTRCEDCSILSTYVVSAEGDMLHVFREADHFGDDQREVAVERCADLVAHPSEAIQCVDPAPLFDCQDALPDAG